YEAEAGDNYTPAGGRSMGHGASPLVDALARCPGRAGNVWVVQRHKAADAAQVCVAGGDARCMTVAAPSVGGLRLDVRGDVVNRLLHRGDLLGFLVRDLALELFLE